MKTLRGLVLCGIMIVMQFSLAGCGKLEFSEGDILINVEEGAHWLHDYPLFAGLTKKNAPQFAIWMEDLEGNFVSTIWVSAKSAKEGWVANNGNRHPESLPYWSHKRGIQYSDGLFMPTKEEPLPDTVSGATPKKSFGVFFDSMKTESFRILAEFNHSIDFNTTYTNELDINHPNYSGGEHGSGQPAVVYSVEFDPAKKGQEVVMELIGHSSPDGSTGDLYRDVSDITTAIHIVEKVTIIF